MDVSPGWLFASMIASTIGFGLFLYGKRQARVPQLVAGLALMVYPSLVSSPAWIAALGGALVAALWLVVRAGL